VQIQIFATDLSEGILSKGRVGAYPESIAMDISSDRLRRFFRKVDNGYQISKNIRDMVVFAKQDLAKDPPFSKLDLISCRNVMIYMSQVLQKRILPLFHYALNPGGILLLGSSETIGGFGDLFVSLDKKHKVYTRKTVQAPVTFDFVPRFQAEEDHPKGEPQHQVDLQKLGEQMLLYRYSPASVIVNDHLDIVQFIGQTGAFLDPQPGDASLNLLRMVKTGLHQELRIAFQKAKRDGTVRKDGVIVEHEGRLKSVNFEISPVKNLPGGERYYLVVLEETNRTGTNRSDSKKEVPEKNTGKKQISATDVENKRLKEELDTTREYLQSIIEEQRTTTRSCARPMKRFNRATKNCKASMKSWKPQKRSCSRLMKS
jgi:two-component system CheB/CheR fusion protein